MAVTLMVRNYDPVRKRYRITVPADLFKALKKSAITHALNKIPTEGARLLQVEKYNKKYKALFKALRKDGSIQQSVSAQQIYQDLKREWNTDFGDESEVPFELNPDDFLTPDQRAEDEMNYWMLPTDQPISVSDYAPPEIQDATYKKVLQIAEANGEATLSDVFNYYRHQKDTVDKSSEFGLATALDHFGDRCVTNISRDEVIVWLDILKSQKLAPSTLKRRMNTVKAAWRMFLIDKERKDLNQDLWANLKYGKENPNSSRLPLHKDHVARLKSFCTGALLANQSQENRDICCLLLHTGARPTEIGGLAPEDIFVEDETPYLWIRANDRRGLKTDGSERIIPLLSNAVNAAKRVRSSNSEKNALSDSLSQKLRKIFDGLDIKFERVTPYSIRHTWRDALVVSDVNETMVDRIMGHSSKKVARVYGSNMGELTSMKQAMIRAYSHLGAENINLYTPDVKRNLSRR